MTRLVELREHLDSQPIELGVHERDALRRAIPAMSVAPVPGTVNSYLLNPRDAVGALSIGELGILIRPKLDIRRLMFLLGYSINPRAWREAPFDFEEDAEIVDAIAAAFVLQVERALRRGVLHGYVSREESLHTVRGRIRFDDQIRDRLGIVPPIECRFDDFTVDVEINRVLLAATNQLRRMPLRDAAVRVRLSRIAAVLADVTEVRYNRRTVPDLIYTRLTDPFRPAAELARLILRGQSFELGAGAVTGEALLLNVSRVFEDFVLVAFREALRLGAREFPAQSRGHPLWLDVAEEGGEVLRLKPDLSWWTGPTCIFVGDAKYKRTPETSGVLHPDVYQMLAYTVATALPTGLLIYAAGEREGTRDYVIRNSDKKILVRTVDLDTPPDHLLRQITSIADEIRRSVHVRAGEASAA